MAVWNFGSINADYFYFVPHIPAPGETLSAHGYATGLGGKGANQSVAAARAGSVTYHLGAVGADGQWALDRLASYGVDVSHVARSNAPTGHAIVEIADDGENAIVILGGANAEQDPVPILEALGGSKAGDYLVLQNETAHQAEVAKAGKERGLIVAYSAAPFDAEAVRSVLSHIDILIMNEIEAQQLSAELDTDIGSLPVGMVLVTKGGDGAELLDTSSGSRIMAPAIKVKPVDTTGAGDTFAGTFVAGLDQGKPPEEALKLASATAALKVTRKGTADAIPGSDEVAAFMATRA